MYQTGLPNSGIVGPDRKLLPKNQKVMYSTWWRLRFPPPPPISKIPPLIGWDFFYPKHRCWCGFRLLPLAHGPPEVVTPNALSAVFSLFSLLPLEHSRPEVAYRRGFAGHRFATWLAGAGATETAKGTKKTARRRCVGAVRRSARTCQRHLVRAHNRTQED